MYLTAHGAMLTAMALFLAGSSIACYNAWNEQTGHVKLFEKLQLAAFALIFCASGALLYGLLARDYSLVYIASYTDDTLSLFYTLAAFWAGQEGSLLFWAFLIAGFGCILIASPTYKSLSAKHKIYFWLFYMFIQAFFLLLIAQMSNPFTTYEVPPAEGRGLNPLLRNIGMVLHPPLLFIGYAGFTIPACLAMGAVMAGEKKAWYIPSQNWILMSWSTLTAGIILGGWWAYMELGWGGYWAWDPVENASLIPWFSATALLHTRIIERRFGYLSRTSVFLACTTFILCVFATYLVRSGVVQSLHAFGQGTVGGPLLFGIVFFSLASMLVIMGMGRSASAPLPSLGSRVGMTVVLVWLLLGLGTIITLGTLWPVLSQFWETTPLVVSQSFYNTVCLPLFVILALIMAIAPWLNWQGGLNKPQNALMTAAVWLGIIVGGILLDIKPSLAVAGVASAVSVFTTTIILAFSLGKKALSRPVLASYGTHAAFALIVLGVAVSGPFQDGWERPMALNESFSANGYTFTYKKLREIKTDSLTINEAEIEVLKNNRVIGILKPQQRLFRNFDHPNSEVSTLFSLGTEFYATIHDIKDGQLQPLRVSIHPMINWVWIGSILISILPLLAWRVRASRKEESHVH